MSDKTGEVSLQSLQRFANDHTFKEDERNYNAVCSAIFHALHMGDDTGNITLQEFAALNPYHTAENKDFADALLNFDEGMTL